MDTPLKKSKSGDASSETNKTIRAFMLVLTHSPAGETVQITWAICTTKVGNKIGESKRSNVRNKSVYMSTKGYYI